MSNSTVLPGFTFPDATLNLWVDGTLGDDTNSGADPLFPCKTIQVAINRLPKTIRHAVTINVAAGNYAGYIVTGFNVQPPVDGTVDYSWLHIKGTMVVATPASTGSATGTLSAFTGLSGTVFAVATDGANNMTTDEYKGMYLQILTGTGSAGTVRFPSNFLILSNTATAFTIVASSNTAPAAASTYQVVKPATIINSAPATLTSNGSPAGLASYVTNSGAVYLANQGFSYAISNIKFSLATAMPRGVLMGENRLRILDCQFIGAAGASSAVSYSTQNHVQSAVDMYCCYISLPASTGFGYINNISGGNASTSCASFGSCFFEGGSGGLLLGGTASGPLVSSCYFKSIDTAIFSSCCMAGQLTTCLFSACGTGIQVSESATQGMGTVAMGLSTCTFTNCTAAAIDLQGAHASLICGTVTGTGNLIGWKLARGARAVIAASCSLTGTTEVSIDAASNDLATMRAATPKLVANSSYLTMYYQ